MEKAQFLSMLTSYLAGKATPEEEHFLYSYYKLFMADEDVLALLKDHEKEKLKLSIKADIDAYIDHPETPIRSLVPWRRIAAAASILLIISAGGYFLLYKPKQVQQVAQNQIHDIAPGHNQATLTLANGQKIVLTKGLTGRLAQQGNATVSVNNGQAITYTSTAGNETTVIQYNTLTTVRGEQSPYPLVLADGTKIWLDAASSVTFPTQFIGRDRIVKITGQAYFEVVHNADHPFKVLVKGQTVEDLGTTFNINAYDDEPVIKTTLLSGKIRLANASGAATLHPGQVAIVATSKPGITVKDVDTEDAVAWKNGYFLFDHESLESAMRKVSRWYDVDIEYADGRINESYIGSANRYANVSEVLKVLQTAGDVRFKVEGKKIVVYKK